MMRNVEQITQLLFGTEHIEEVSVAELRDMVEEFPSFIAGHYLLSKKLQTAGHESYLPETQRTSLYFTNPFWLQWLLADPQNQEAAESAEWKYPVEEEPKPSEAPYHETHIMPELEVYSGETISGELTVDPGQRYSFPEETIPETATTLESESSNPVSNKVQEEQILQVETPASGEISEPPIIEHAPKNHFFWEKEFYVGEAVAAPQADKSVDASDHDEPANHAAMLEHIGTVEEPAEFESVEARKQEQDNQYPENPAFLLAEEDDTHQDEQPTLVDQSIISPEHHSETFPESPLETTMETFHEISADQSIEATHSLASAAGDSSTQDLQVSTAKEEFVSGLAPEPASADINNGTEAIAFAHSFDQGPADTISETEEMVSVQSTAESFAPTKIETEEAASIQSPALASSDAPLEDELKFEPYHTIDYFASLGIKFIQEENPSDQFGKQLKSFTAWLKTMKRLPTTMLDTELNAVTEATIQDIAEHSIEEKEVLTEAMAEVLAMQGKMEKAIEIYHKLSLLNPSKSAYFAARIEHFKVN